MLAGCGLPIVSLHGDFYLPIAVPPTVLLPVVHGYMFNRFSLCIHGPSRAHKILAVLADYPVDHLALLAILQNCANPFTLADHRMDKRYALG